jgi:hypothetical protein
MYFIAVKLLSSTDCEKCKKKKIHYTLQEFLTQFPSTFYLDILFTLLYLPYNNGILPLSVFPSVSGFILELNNHWLLSIAHRTCITSDIIIALHTALILSCMYLSYTTLYFDIHSKIICIVKKSPHPLCHTLHFCGIVW